MAAAIIAGVPVSGLHAEYLTSVNIRGVAAKVQARVDESGTETQEVEWTEVTLPAAGSLGVEVLYKADKLSDVDNLRVTGPMNDQDWSTLNNMNLVRLDLSGATASSIPDRTFYNKSRLESFLFPQGVTSIGEYAFYQCGLKEIVIPSSVAYLAQYCFKECTGLTRVEWNCPSNVPANCFDNCNNLTSFVMSDGATTIGDYAFHSCDKLAEVRLSGALNSIGRYAFYNCKALTEVSFPETLTTIGQSAFSYCGLVRVVLPDAVSSIGSYAFDSNSALGEVVLPANVFVYDQYEFGSCYNIRKVTCRAATPPTISNGNNPLFNSSIRPGCTLVVPDFAVVDYKLHDYWHNFGTITGGVQSDAWTIASSLSLLNDRRMDGTPSVTIKGGGSLAVGGSAPMPMNDFRVESDLRYNYLSYGQLINSSPAMTAQSGGLRLKTYSDRWYFICMPCNVKLSQVSHSAGASFVFRYYDGETRGANASTGAGWKNVAADGVLEAGKAYIYQCSEEGDIIMPLESDGLAGLLDNTHRVTPVNAWASESALHSGWNLIGNPWLSYFDMAYTGLTCPVTVWNDNNRNYVAYSLIDDDVVLAPMQAFFMQQTDTDSEVTFDIQGRQLTSQVSRPASVKSRSSETASRSVFNIVISGDEGEAADRMRIVLNDEASEEYEPGRDASKFFSEESKCAELYSIDIDGNELAINERPSTTERVAVGVTVPQAGRYVIKCTRADGSVTLYDNLNGRNADLGAGEEYRFDADAKGQINDRFFLALRPHSSALESIESGAAEATESEIYTLDGVKVPSEATLGAGVYIVKNGNGVSKKIVK